MRRLISLSTLVGLMVAFVLPAFAGEEDAQALIKKAIKAHFPKGLDEKKPAQRIKNKGTLHVMGLDLEFNQEVSIYKGKFKEVMEMTVKGKTITVVSVFDGKNAWIRAGDQDVPINDDIVNAFKEASESMGLMHGAFLVNKSIKYSLTGEVKVKDKTALGLNLSREGKKDIALFIDKKTHLICKIEMRTRDLMSGQEVTEERYITEYQELAGNKVAKKVEVLRDGKALLEAEVLEVQAFEKFEDAEFARPK